MHSLDIIIKRNAVAAGREHAHALNDEDYQFTLGCEVANLTAVHDNEIHDYVLGYRQGRQEN